MVTVALVLGAVARPALAGDVDPALAAALHLKILSFDLSLKKQAGSSLSIAVVYKAGSADSERAAREIGRALSSLATGKKVTVAGKRVEVVVLSNDELARRGAVDVVYAASGLDAELVALSSGRRVLTGNRAYLGRGAAIAVVEKAGKPSIVIQLKNAEKAGMSLDPKLLRLSEVIR